MAHIIADRVRESSTTTGTTDFALNGAVPDFKALSDVCANGDTVDYIAILPAGGGWEQGIGTYSTTGPTLARTTITASSTGSKISFGVGAKDIFLVFPARAAGIHGLTGKTTPVDADETAIWDSAASALKKLTWASLKATLKATTAQFLANTAGYFLTTDQVWGVGATVALTSKADATITCTSASPGVITDTAHGFTGTEPVSFSNSGGALPTGITAGTEYYVKTSSITTNTYTLTTDRAGTTPVNTSSTGSGTNTRRARLLVDGNLGSFFTHTLTRNITLANPYNWKAGQSGRLTLTNGSGPYTLTYNAKSASGYGAAGGTALALTATNGAIDKLYIDAESSTDVTLSIAKAFA